MLSELVRQGQYLGCQEDISLHQRMVELEQRLTEVETKLNII